MGMNICWFTYTDKPLFVPTHVCLNSYINIGLSICMSHDVVEDGYMGIVTQTDSAIIRLLNITIMESDDEKI